MKDMFYSIITFFKSGQYILLGGEKALIITGRFGKWHSQEIQRKADLATIAEKNRLEPWTILIDDACIRFTAQPFPKMVPYEVTRALNNLTYFNEGGLVAGGGWYEGNQDKGLINLFKIKQGPAIEYWLPALTQYGFYVKKCVPYPLLIAAHPQQATYHIEKTLEGIWRHTFIRNGKIELLRYIAAPDTRKEQDQEQTLSFINNEYGLTSAELAIYTRNEFLPTALFQRLALLPKVSLYLVKFKQQSQELENSRRLYAALKSCKGVLFAALGCMLYMLFNHVTTYQDFKILQTSVNSLPLSLQALSTSESQRIVKTSLVRDSPLDMIQVLQAHKVPHLLFDAITWTKKDQRITLELAVQSLKVLAEEEVKSYLKQIFPQAIAIHAVGHNAERKRYEIIVKEKL